MKFTELNEIFWNLALTHMRWNNDEKLARRVKNIDIILGGLTSFTLLRSLSNRLALNFY